MFERSLKLGLVGLGLVACCVSASWGDHDPHRTATIFVQGFEPDGAERHGVFGDDFSIALLTEIASTFGLPTTDQPGGPSQPNVLAATTFYGDIPPAWYSSSDRQALAAVTTQWGGGVPRYALILANYARHVMERAGSEQVNFIGTSFGALVVRWLIEHDVGGLAGDGKIARFLSVEGVLCGNWAASRSDLVDLWGRLGGSIADIRQMEYGWIESNLHAPRDEADDPNYARILIGQIASTNDVSGGEALSDAMLAYDQFRPNDGVQAVPDAKFRVVTERSRYLGRMPTTVLFHSDHLGIKERRGAWLQAAAFLTQRRRVTVTLKSAQLTDVHEPHDWYWNWMPAEVVFESRVYSPLASMRWAIDDPISELGARGAAAPLRRFDAPGQTKQIDQLIFDDMVFDDEDALRIELGGREIDYNLRYEVFETVQQPYDDDLGGGTLVVSARNPGTYTFQNASWNATIEVQIVQYPFALPVDTAVIPSPVLTGLRLDPNPFSRELRITVADPRSLALHADDQATLEIYDADGRRVRRLPGALHTGFTWDGRDERGQRLPAGVYFQRLTKGPHVVTGKAILVR